MEFINQHIKQDEFLLVNLKGEYYVMDFLDGEDELGQKKILNNAQSKELMIYYINVLHKLREKYNKQKIHKQIQSVLNQQIYHNLIETDEANEMAKMNMYSENSSEDADIDNYGDIDESFDQNKQISFKISEQAKIREICKNIDIFIESILNLVAPGVSNQQYSSCSGFNKDQENEIHSQTYSYVDDTLYNLYIRLVKPSIIDKILHDPLKINLNLLHVDDEGFTKSPSYSFFNDLQHSFKKLNIQLEVKNLQLNIYFKKKKTVPQNPKKFFENYINFVKKVTIDMEWIYTKQILEIYVQFNESQSRYITKHINNQINNIVKKGGQISNSKVDISKYQIKVKLHNTLNAAILNDIKVNLINSQPNQFIKKIYYSNELKSDWFQFLALNNNIAFIHTQQFNDSNDIKYIKYKFKNLKKNNTNEQGNKNALNYQDSENDFDYYQSQSSMTSLSDDFFSRNPLNMREFEMFSSEDDFSKNIEELPLDKKYFQQYDTIDKSKNIIRHNIFDIYKRLIDNHFANQTFVFCAYDIHSQQLQRITKSTGALFNIYDLIHAKTCTMLSILAYQSHISQYISYKPQIYLWDQYFE